MKFQIGEKVWWAMFTPMIEGWTSCPACEGEGRIQVIMGSREAVFLACDYCGGRGLDGPSGKVITYRPVVCAQAVTITGIEIREGERYYCDSYIIEAADLFNNEQEAVARAEETAAAYRTAEDEKLRQKEKPSKSWGWHVSYHKRHIEEAQKQIDHHTAKLNVASLKKRK